MSRRLKEEEDDSGNDDGIDCILDCVSRVVCPVAFAAVARVD
jgi:hypothetical protein